jgi:hypothetical protein
MPGTNLFTPLSSAVNVALTEVSGLAMLISSGSAFPTTASTFQIGCLGIRTDNGTLYQNTGTVAVPVWTQIV